MGQSRHSHDHDVCGPGTIGVFKREFGQNAKVWDRRRVVIIPDHYIFTADSKSNRNVDILRDFVREQELPYFYDVIDDPNGHWVFDPPRETSNANMALSTPAFATLPFPKRDILAPVKFFSEPTLILAWPSLQSVRHRHRQYGRGLRHGTGKLLLKVPETMHFRLEGQLPSGVMAKDIILHCIGEIGFDGATYKALQFDGPGAASLTLDDRMTVANMAIEAGGKNGIFEFDQKTEKYVNERTSLNGTQTSYEPVETRCKGAVLLRVVVDLSKLEPTVGLPS
jgi:3-isopropylmalate/(R)-2-methylmalate dehydratase large subunit